MNAQLNKLLMENQQLSKQIHLLRQEQLAKSGEVSILRQKCNNLEKQWAETKTLLSVKSEELLGRESEVARAKEEEVGRLKIELEFKEQELMATQANLRSLLRIDRNHLAISPSQPSQQIQSVKPQERPAIVQQKEVTKKFKLKSQSFVNGLFYVALETFGSNGLRYFCGMIMKRLIIQRLKCFLTFFFLMPKTTDLRWRERSFLLSVLFIELTCLMTLLINGLFWSVR